MHVFRHNLQSYLIIKKVLGCAGYPLFYGISHQIDKLLYIGFAKEDQIRTSSIPSNFQSHFSRVKFTPGVKLFPKLERFLRKTSYPCFGSNFYTPLLESKIFPRPNIAPKPRPVSARNKSGT